MRLTIQIFLLTMFFNYNLTAQSDCGSAVFFCVENRFEVFQESSSGTVAENLVEGCDISPFTIDTETNAYWVRYEFCLLYTSPSPRDRTRSRMPSSA